MKKILLLGVVVFALTGCFEKKSKGDLVGAPAGNSFSSEAPFGMAHIPAGAFTMGAADYDIASTMTAPSRTVSVASFSMDETEITNNEYRQFVYWVRDSLVRYNLAMRAYEDDLIDDEGIGYYRFKDVDTSGSPYYQYLLDKNASAEDSDIPEGRYLDWSKDIEWDINNYPSVEYAEILDSMYLPVEERFFGARTLDARKLEFTYFWVDMQKAVRKGGNRKDYIFKEQLNVYPDTTVWVRDFSYSYNEPMMRDYFWHAAYNEYPVVGVTFDQAVAFCAWRTKVKNDFLRSNGDATVPAFRLPTEAEWEYAARGGLEYATFPWGGPYAEDSRGQFMANFKPMRGDYLSDGALYTVQTDAYFPNDYGLFNMAGNVSEWTSTAYDVSSYYYVSTMNPNYENSNNKRKVIRGGSWKDVAYYLHVSTRDYEYKDTARSFIGFRTVQSSQGTGMQ
ncbi:MAG: gliding motility lipoprotein GldK [Flavobacteriales bacterium]|nr:gliding motility lipoprotein GldK [Flavobacteriales bacterium]